MGLLTEKHKSCPLPKNEADLLLVGKPIAGPFTFQHIMFLVSIVCAAVTMAISLFLISKHLHRYTEPRQQRQIIRIIFTPVVFSFLSAMSILNYHVAQYMTPLTELYEAFGLAALFLLFIEYVAPDSNTRDVFFSQLENRKPRGAMFKPSKEYDVIPGGCLRWYKSKFVVVFLYVMVDILTAVIQEISQATGDYCATSFSPRFAHVWVFVIKNIALFMAVTAILQFYGRMRHESEFARHSPLAKLASFKLIVGVNFFQQTIFNILIGAHVIHGSTSVTGLDITFGLPATLVAFEQILFAVFFHYAFRSREYHEDYSIPMKFASDSGSVSSSQTRNPRMGMLRAAMHAFNPWDLISSCGKALLAVFKLIGGSNNNEASYADWNEQSGLPVTGHHGRRTGHRHTRDDSSHLEPMRPVNGYESPRYDGDTEYTNSYPHGMITGVSAPAPAMHVPPPHSTEHMSGSNPYGPVSYYPQPPPEYERADAVDESSRLTPGHYYVPAQSSSRDSSMDRNQPSLKNVV